MQTVTLEAKVLTVSDLAIKIKALPWDVWIPRSQIVDCDTDADEIAEGDEITIEIPYWLAKHKELVE